MELCFSLTTHPREGLDCVSLVFILKRQRLHGRLGRKDTKLLCIQNIDCFCHLNKDWRREEKGKGCFQGKSRGEFVDAKEKRAGIFPSSKE